MFDSWELALAAYNAGEGNVARAIAYNQKKGLPTDFIGISPRLRPETRNYVPKLIAVKNIVLSPAAYGIDLESVPDEPYFTEVQAPKKIDVKVAAKLAGMSQDEFVALNPSHNNAVASGTGVLIVPVDKADDFKANLEKYDQPLVSWTTYQAHRGESLDAIAKRHNTSPAQLKAANNDLKLDKRSRLKVAGPVMVPMKRDANATIKVAAITPPSRDATTLIPATVRFGRTGVEVAQIGFSFSDVDGDGDIDVVFEFKVRGSGIRCGDTAARLTGLTTSGPPFDGADSIFTIGCGP
jgi:membrane-bound lytic murein transglycosylase D